MLKLAVFGPCTNTDNLKDSMNRFSQTGINVFNANSFLSEYQEGMHFNKDTVFQMADYLIWSHDADTKYKLKSANYYLPNLCSRTENNLNPFTRGFR
jgi:hypothetical protein